ncbi:MAG: 2-C-methyl-D-erythritol 4-phosphate cytidylyltransferase [Anaerolineales bacterium]|nr:2-C-methyl-D-erythritol 4-phosphate cytidylyltransferase [Anaerolineales bacterium]
MKKILKVVIPMAGYGKRLRPHTWSRPKQLISLAGKTVIEHVLDTFATLPADLKVEYVFVVGYLGDKIQTFMEEEHPELTVHFVVQEEMRGQSHAIYLAKEYIDGPMVMVFADTLIETDLSFLDQEKSDIVAWVKPVPDPRRFGVAEVGKKQRVTRLIEKPKAMDNNLALVGFYYFKKGQDLIQAIEMQMDQKVQLKGEFFLADAINIMLESGSCHMRTQKVNVWLDAGTFEAVLSTNRYLLDHGHDNSEKAGQRMGVNIIPPVYIHPEAEVESSVIGPHATIEAGCRILGSVIQNSIIEKKTQVEDVILEASLIGQFTVIKGESHSINIGDHTEIEI